MTINELADVLDRLRKAREAKTPCCLPPQAAPIDPRIDARFESLERTNAAIVSVLEKLQKSLEKSK